MSTNSTNDPLSQELKKLLAQPLEKIRQWESSCYDELAGPLSKSLVLFGAGGLGRKTLHGLQNLGIQPLAFTDNNSDLYDKEIEGVRVLAPAQAVHEFGKTAIFLITVYTDSAPSGNEPIIQKLKGLGCQNVILFAPLYWKYPEHFLPHYAYDLPHKVIASADSIDKAWSLFNDPISRNEYLAQIHWRLNPEFNQIPAQAEHEIYFPPDLFTLNDNEVFVDCGAYTGDTIRSFLQQTKGQFKELLAFEPDSINYKKLVELIATLPKDVARRIKTSDLALGRCSEQLYFNAQGVASSSLSVSGGVLIHSEPLDSIIIDKAPTYIKMDIEGAEIEALEGSIKQIRAYLPILAISVYHYQDHIWNIPLMLHSLSTDYQFYLRRYTPHVLDDLVLYAIPAHRQLA